MRTVRIAVMVGLLSVAMAGTAAYGASADENWPTWRGPNYNGAALTGNPPIKWSETKNIKWKVELPGSGSSTPIVWENQIFVTTAVSTVDPPSTTAPYKFNLISLDRHTGKILWERTAREAVPHEGHHATNSFASYSPVTDGQKIWVSFGSRGLHCYDLQGNHLWSADLPQMVTRNAFGEGSSAAIAGDAIIVLADQEGQSKILAFNKDTGDLLWEKDRDEVTSWATPRAVEVDGVMQVITVATNLIRSYDAKTGDIIWQCSGLTSNVIPTPVLGFGNIYCTSGYRGAALLAIKLGSTGDLSGSDAIAWSLEKDTPYVASPLLYEDKIYVTRGLGSNIACYDAKTGKPIFQRQKLEGIKQLYASPVAAGGRIYVAGRGGLTAVLKHGNTFKVLAINTLDDGFDASPIIVGDNLYLKGIKNLYCIAK